jgi:hypothetical protein
MTLKARIRAIDRFIKGCREDGIYDDLNACCVMAGWSNLAGALTPLKGAVPTNSGFLYADLDRGIGLTGNGSSKYLDSNRANNADGQNDNHNAVFVSHIGPGVLMASAGTATGLNWIDLTGTPAARFFSRSNSAFQQVSAELQTGLYAQSRAASSAFRYFCPQDANEKTATSQTPNSANQIVFAYTNDGVSFASFSTSTIPFYSIGSSLGSDPATGLAALDARVSTLMADLRAIEEAGFDRDAIAYIRSVEAADGAYLETSVKIAINNLVSGLKADSLWDAIGASCLLCGPRTLAGALVPLRGDAPTPNGFVSGDYSRTDGLRDPGGTSYLDSNASADEYGQDDVHGAVFTTTKQTAYGRIIFGNSNGGTFGMFPGNANQMQIAVNHSSGVLNVSSTGIGDATGLLGCTRSSASEISYVAGTQSATIAQVSTTPLSENIGVFARSNGLFPSDPTIAFYSFGSGVGASGLAALATQVSSYVTAIGAAV